MIYLIIALALVLAGAGYLGWRLFRTARALGMAETKCKSLQKAKAQQRNLQVMLDKRNAEARRLRARVSELEEDMAAAEQQASELNLNLFHESSLRILREKEDGARRMKLEQAERELDAAREALKRERLEAKETIDRLNDVVERQRAELERLTAPQPRRSVRRREGLPNQITLDDLIGR